MSDNHKSWPFVTAMRVVSIFIDSLSCNVSGFDSMNSSELGIRSTGMHKIPLFVQRTFGFGIF